jgi:hypothetical protein
MAIRKKKETAEKAEVAEKNTTTVAPARKTAGRKTAARRAPDRTEPIADASAIQRGTRQSPRKMRLVIKYQRKLENMTPDDAKFHRPQLIDRLAGIAKKISRKLFGRR